MQPLPAVLQRYFEGLQAHDVDCIASTVADSVAFVTKDRTLTKEQFLAVLRALYAGFPDWQYEFGAPEFRGDAIAVMIRQGGQHTGTLALPGLDAVEATGKRVRFEHYFFYKVSGDCIVEISPETVVGGAPFGIFEQLGVPVPK